MTKTEPVVYFHGLPGGPSELNAIGAGALGLGIELFAPNRQLMNKGASLYDHFEMLTSAIQTRFDGSTIRFVGFSAGAYVALEVASRIGRTVSHISLVSSAAPLTTGTFLPDMEGKAVFRLAKQAPFLFAAMTSVQALALHIAPDGLFNALFAQAQGKDRELAKQPYFRASMIESLKQCLESDATNYRRELIGYVQDWSAILPLISQPVELWHGNADNWAPVLMADALAKALPNVSAIHKLEGQSHYSTLQFFFERYVTQTV